MDDARRRTTDRLSAVQSCPVLSSSAQSCPVLFSLNQFCAVMSTVQYCSLISGVVHSCPVVSSFVQFCPVLFNVVHSCLHSCLVLPSLDQSCVVLTILFSSVHLSSSVQSCLVLSSPVQSCPVATTPDDDRSDANRWFWALIDRDWAPRSTTGVSGSLTPTPTSLPTADVEMAMRRRILSLAAQPVNDLILRWTVSRTGRYSKPGEARLPKMSVRMPQCICPLQKTKICPYIWINVTLQESLAAARVTRDSSACMKAPMVEI